MRLKKIEIENFKGIASRQTIELKPITLLFGPNSAGKSTIIQALHYLREILERHNVNPDLTIAGGLIDLGGFSTLVHSHELDRAVHIKVILDLSDQQGSDTLQLNSGMRTNDMEFEELQLRYLFGESADLKDYAIVQEVGVGVELTWSELELAPFVSRLSIELDGEHFAAIVSPPQAGRAQLTDFNFAHPLLRRVANGGDEPNEGFETAMSSSPLEDEVRSLAREVALDRSTAGTPDGQFRIAVGTVKGALPNLDRELELDLRDPDEKKFELEQQTPRVRGLRRLLSEMVLGPARLVRDHLCAMTYIGPLREIPSRGYRPQVSPDEARWATGLAAWDLLYTDRRGGLIEEVNGWISDDSRLNTGYRLERVDFKEIPVPGLFHQIFERGLTEDDIGELQEIYTSLQSRTEIALRDFAKGILVSPSDVGIGISQMVPVVVSALRAQDGLLAIEQPELHVHPAIQVGLGDLLIRAVRLDPDRFHSGKTVLIETHSEHIMLRLLRRIRETAEEELPPNVTGLRPDDLSVIYVEGRDDGVRFRPLRIDQSGEFLDRWPRGFFEERGEELF
jgi:predicted ATPase